MRHLQRLKVHGETPGSVTFVDCAVAETPTDGRIKSGEAGWFYMVDCTIHEQDVLLVDRCSEDDANSRH